MINSVVRNIMDFFNNIATNKFRKRFSMCTCHNFEHIIVWHHTFEQSLLHLAQIFAYYFLNILYLILLLPKGGMLRAHVNFYTLDTYKTLVTESIIKDYFITKHLVYFLTIHVSACVSVCSRSNFWVLWHRNFIFGVQIYISS